MTKVETKPRSVPADAVFNSKDNEWELGERRGKLCVGAWTWWRPDGILIGKTTFDDRGKLNGICRRFHPNGELSLEAPYQHGVLHGRQIMTRAAKGSSPENPILKTLKGVYRMDTLHIAGVAQGIATFYNRKGLLAPVACGRNGKSVNLGAQLSKLLPTTAMTMVAPFLHTMTGKLPTSMVRVVHYICLAVVNSNNHRIQVTDDQGKTSVTIVAEEEISRALSLAVDYRAAQLKPLAT